MVSKSRNITNLGKWPCVRAGNIAHDECHPCYFCGYPIPLGTTQCDTCDFMICPKCSGCFCTATAEERIALIIIHFSYCRILDRLRDFEDFGPELDFAPSEFKEHCREALLYCSQCVKELQDDSTIKS